MSRDKYVLASDGARIWKLPWNSTGNGTVLWEPSVSIGFLTRMRGNASNDVFIVGHFGECGHFNGSTWHWYSELRVSSGRILQGLSVKNDLVAAVGLSGSGAIAIIGRRQ